MLQQINTTRVEKISKQMFSLSRPLFKRVTTLLSCSLKFVKLLNIFEIENLLPERSKRFVVRNVLNFYQKV